MTLSDEGGCRFCVLWMMGLTQIPGTKNPASQAGLFTQLLAGSLFESSSVEDDILHPKNTTASSVAQPARASAPCFNDLLIRVDEEFPSEFREGSFLTDEQAGQLGRISSAASQTVTLITSGLAAMGELLAYVGTTGELSNDSLTSTGWLIQHLAETAGRLHDESQAADYKLHKLPRSAPQKAVDRNRGAGGAAC